MNLALKLMLCFDVAVIPLTVALTVAVWWLQRSARVQFETAVLRLVAEYTAVDGAPLHATVVEQYFRERALVEHKRASFTIKHFRDSLARLVRRGDIEQDGANLYSVTDAGRQRLQQTNCWVVKERLTSEGVEVPRPPVDKPRS